MEDFSVFSGSLSNQVELLLLSYLIFVLSSYYLRIIFVLFFVFVLLSRFH